MASPLTPSAFLLGTSPIPFLSSSSASKPPIASSSSVGPSTVKQQGSYNYGSSPIATYSIYGTSPPPSGAVGSSRSTNERQSPHSYNAAKKFYSRLLYDTSLNSIDFTIGVVESLEQPGERRRVTERLMELPFIEYHARHQQGDLTTCHSQGDKSKSKSSYSKVSARANPLSTSTC